MSDISVILLVVIALAIGVMVFLLARLLVKLGQTRATFVDVVGKEISIGVQPVADQLRQLATSAEHSSAALTQALDTSREHLAQVTHAVSDLKGELKASHNQFQGAVMTLAEPGHLQEWVETLHGVVQPLEAIRGNVDGHYQANERVLEMTGDLLNKWAGSGANLEAHLQQLVKSMAEWTVQEDVCRRSIEQRIMQRLQELNTQSQQVAQNHLKLENEVIQLTTTTGDLSAEMQRASIALSQLAKDQERAHEDQLQIIADLRHAGTDIADRYGALTGTLVNVGAQIERIGTSTETHLQQARNEVDRLAQESEKAIRSFHEQHQQMLGNLQEQYRAMAEQQSSVARQTSAILTDLPDRKYQRFGTYLLGGLLVSNFVIVILLILR